MTRRRSSSYSKRRPSRASTRGKSNGNATTVVILPKKKASASLGRRQKSRRRGVVQVKDDVKKALNEVRKETVPQNLRSDVEAQIRKLTKEQDADLKVFKTVAGYMFKDPRFSALIEDRYGVTIGKGLHAYLRTVGVILEAVLGTWISVAGVFSIAMSITKFIFNIVYFSLLMTVRLVDKLGVLPSWLSNRISTSRKSSKGQVLIRIVPS